MLRDNVPPGQGGDGTLGIPPDGTYTDGMQQLVPSDKINDAIDQINEKLLKLHPEPSDLGLINADEPFFDGNMWSASNSGGPAFVQAGISDPKTNHSVGVFTLGATELVSRTQVFTFQTLREINRLNNDLDAGSTLTLKIKLGSDAPITISTLVVSGFGVQDNADTAGLIKVFGSDDGKSNGNPDEGEGLVQLPSCFWSGFIKVVVDFTDPFFTSLGEGAFTNFDTQGGQIELILEHVALTGTFTDQLTDYTDAGDTSGGLLYEGPAVPFPASNVQVDVDEGAGGATADLSGVTYADTGFIFNIALASAEDVFKNSFKLGTCLSMGLAAYGESDINNTAAQCAPTSPPEYDAVASINAATFSAGPALVGTLDARATLEAFDSISGSAQATASSENHRICTYPAATVIPTPSLPIDFKSELYRATAVANAYDQSASGNLSLGVSPLDWDSSMNVSSYDGSDGLQQICNNNAGQLRYPQGDFGLGTGVPNVAGPDYTAAAGTRVARYIFETPTSISNGTLTWTGNFDFSDIDFGGSQPSRILLRVPELGKGYVDLGKPEGHPDGDGALFATPAASAKSVQFSLSKASSSFSNGFFLGQTKYYLIVLVEFKDPGGTGFEMDSLDI